MSIVSFILPLQVKQRPGNKSDSSNVGRRYLRNNYSYKTNKVTMNKLSEAEVAHSKKLVEKVLTKGMAITSKITLAKLAGLRYERVKNLFIMYPELEEMRKATLTHLVDKAMDNLVSIVEDPSHKDHFQATKHVLTKYKTELDTELERQDSESIQVRSEDEGFSITFATTD